jgi:hypothetical protein
MYYAIAPELRRQACHVCLVGHVRLKRNGRPAVTSQVFDNGGGPLLLAQIVDADSCTGRSKSSRDGGADA